MLRIRRILQSLRHVDSLMTADQSSVVGMSSRQIEAQEQEIAADAYADSSKLSIN
jgi:hypothetical protein